MTDSIEKFSIGKFFSGFVNPVSWAKDLKTIITIVIILFTGFTLYRAYIQPRNVQQQKPQINVASGGVANINFDQKQQTKERRWFIGPTVMISKDKNYYIGVTILRSF